MLRPSDLKLPLDHDEAARLVKRSCATESACGCGWKD